MRLRFLAIVVAMSAFATLSHTAEDSWFQHVFMFGGDDPESDVYPAFKIGFQLAQSAFRPSWDLRQYFKDSAFQGTYNLGPGPDGLGNFGDWMDDILKRQQTRRDINQKVLFVFETHGNRRRPGERHTPLRRGMDR